MTGPVLALRVEGYTIEEIAHLLALDPTDARQQFAVDLEACPYGHLGETFAVHLLRCDALSTALDVAETRDPTPAKQARIDQYRASFQAMHQGALDTANRAAIARADRGQP